MLISELINVLRSYDPAREILISSEDDLWSLEIGSFREATLYETSGKDIVDSTDYSYEKDGPVENTREAVLIDLDI